MAVLVKVGLGLANVSSLGLISFKVIANLPRVRTYYLDFRGSFDALEEDATNNTVGTTFYVVDTARGLLPARRTYAMQIEK